MVPQFQDPADESTRFVMEPDSPYLRNLAALWAVDPRLAEAIENAPHDPFYAIEIAKSGDPTLAISNASGKKVYLHSKYQPVDEAKRLIDALNITEQCVFYVHGFGLGYHVESLREKISDESFILVFEPDLNILRAAFEARDLSGPISSKRVMFFWQADKANKIVLLMRNAFIKSNGLCLL